MKNWLITGGAGFIGSHLASDLGAIGHRVTIVDNMSSGRPQNIAECDHARLVVDNIANLDQIKALASSCDGIFHLAARVSVQGCIDHWLDGHNDNLVGTLNVFEAASEHNIPVVYASSAAVYGNQGNSVCSEGMKEAPISPYGADKLACEHQACAYFHAKSLSSIGLRFFNVYGPRQDPSSPYAGVVSKFADNIRNKRPHTIFGDGEQSRDFVYVKDVARALKGAMQILIKAPEPMFDVCNVCTGIRTSLLEITEVFSKLQAHSEQEAIFEDGRTGDIRDSLGDTKHMNKLLKLKDMTSVSDGLAEYLQSHSINNG